jgi:hypothetical protein
MRISSFFDWLPLLFSLEWWGFIRYEVYGYPAVCRWREPGVSRILGNNRQPTVPGVLDPDMSRRRGVFSKRPPFK